MCGFKTGQTQHADERIHVMWSSIYPRRDSTIPIHFLLLIHGESIVGLEVIPAVTGQEAENTLDRLPGCHRVNTERQIASHAYSQFRLFN